MNKAKIKEIAKRLSIPYVVHTEVYPHLKKAVKGHWRLGKIHNEWNELILENDFVVIKAPRGHLKTFFFFEILSLVVAKANAGVEIKYYTGSDTLAIEKLENVKKYARLPYFRSLLNGAETDNKTEIKFGNGSKIIVQGWGSKTRGGHPDWIILDDIIDSSVIYSDEQNLKSRERLASEVIPMAEPHTKIIMIGTIQREDDVYSVDWEKVLKEEAELDMKVVSKSYDAIVDEEKKLTLFPEKWDWKTLMQRKKMIVELRGEAFFNKEYRNMPLSALGTIIKAEWKKTYRKENIKDLELSLYTGWDLSVGKNIDKGDYTAKVTFAVDYTNHMPDYYIISVYRDRIDMGKRVRNVLYQGEYDNPVAVGIEDNVFQFDTVQAVQKNSNLNIVPVHSHRNKIEKFQMMLQPLFENGRVYLLEGDPMQEKFWQELLALPRGAHDDMADAFCTGLQVVEEGSLSLGYIEI